jgi:hypothetical protein
MDYELPTLQEVLDQEPSWLELKAMYEGTDAEDHMWTVPSVGTIECLGVILVPCQEGTLAIPYEHESYDDGPRLDYYDGKDILYSRTELECLVQDFNRYGQGLAKWFGVSVKG